MQIPIIFFILSYFKSRTFQRKVQDFITSWNISAPSPHQSFWRTEQSSNHITVTQQHTILSTKVAEEIGMHFMRFPPLYSHGGQLPYLLSYRMSTNVLPWWPTPVPSPLIERQLIYHSARLHFPFSDFCFTICPHLFYLCC